MPNRVLRESILNSERVNAVSQSAELHYRRLMSKVDDYGRIEASPRILKAEAWAMREDVTVEQIAEWTMELTAGPRPLILRYEVNGREYLEYQNFKQRIRTAKDGKTANSLCPNPPVPSSDGHARAVDGHTTVTRPSLAASRAECLSSECLSSKSVVRSAEPENGGTAATSSNPIKSTATGASEPCEPPCDDLDKLAWSLASDLMAAHCKFSPGRLDTARSVIERILATAVNPRAVATAARESHRKYMIFWAKKRAENPRCFIPQLAKWFQESDYLDPPGVDTATAAEGQPWKKIAAQIEGRRG